MRPMPTAHTGGLGARVACARHIQTSRNLAINELCLFNLML